MVKSCFWIVKDSSAPIDEPLRTDSTDPFVAASTYLVRGAEESDGSLLDLVFT